MTAILPTSTDAALARTVLVTGPAGAGRGTAIRALEDLGFEAIDNLPLRFVPRLLEEAGGAMALGIDPRNRDFSAEATLSLIDAAGPGLEVLYLDCSAEVLVRRFSETRRRHPLAPAETLEEGIAREVDVLAPIRDRGGILIDTTELTPHDLRAEIERWFGGPGSGRLALSVHSFSYKRGLPRGLDMVFDVRFLRNPHWNPELRPRDGRDAEVAAFIAADPRFEAFYGRMADLTTLLLPAYVDEGKSHLAIGFGCTGGRHRSVAVAERLVNTLADLGWQVSIRHRELDRAVAVARARPEG